MYWKSISCQLRRILLYASGQKKCYCPKLLLLASVVAYTFFISSWPIRVTIQTQTGDANPMHVASYYSARLKYKKKCHLCQKINVVVVFLFSLIFAAPKPIFYYFHFILSLLAYFWFINGNILSIFKALQWMIPT